MLINSDAVLPKSKLMKETKAWFCVFSVPQCSQSLLCIQFAYMWKNKEKIQPPSPAPQHLRQNWFEKSSQVTHKNQPLMTCMHLNKITFLRLLLIPTDMILQSLIVKANKEMTRTHAHKSHNLLLLLSVLFSILWFQKLGENS